MACASQEGIYDLCILLLIMLVDYSCWQDAEIFFPLFFFVPHAMADLPDLLIPFLAMADGWGMIAGPCPVSGPSLQLWE